MRAILKRRLELALTLALSRKRERGLVPLSRLREKGKSPILSLY